MSFLLERFSVKILSFPSNLGEDCFNSRKITTKFRNTRWRWLPSSALMNVPTSNYSCVLSQILNSPLDLKLIHLIVKNWRTISERRDCSIRDCGIRQLKFRFNCNFSGAVAYCGLLSWFNQTSWGCVRYSGDVTTDFRKTDGDGCHLEFWQICISEVKVAFYYRFSTFQSYFVRLSSSEEMATNCEQFWEVKMVASANFNFSTNALLHNITSERFYCCAHCWKNISALQHGLKIAHTTNHEHDVKTQLIGESKIKKVSFSSFLEFFLTNFGTNDNWYEF